MTLMGAHFGRLAGRAQGRIAYDAKAAADSATVLAVVGKLDAAARSGNRDALKAAVGPVGNSCKGCHDDFRNAKYSN